MFGSESFLICNLLVCSKKVSRHADVENGLEDTGRGKGKLG